MKDNRAVLQHKDTCVAPWWKTGGAWPAIVPRSAERPLLVERGAIEHDPRGDIVHRREQFRF